MPVCITGEPGTEKKAIALLIHKESEFSNGPFVNFDFQSVDSYEIDDFLFDTRKMLKGKTVIQKADSWNSVFGKHRKPKIKWSKKIN